MLRFCKVGLVVTANLGSGGGRPFELMNIFVVFLIPDSIIARGEGE